MGYLVLTRQGNESVHIGRDIRITVIKVRGSRVRLGILAPEDVTVDRAEVAAAKIRQDRVARTLRADGRPRGPKARNPVRVPACAGAP